MVASNRKYIVGGVEMKRPFKIRRLGHFGFNSNLIEENRHFYVDLLGFRVSQFAVGGFFARHNSDHHSMVVLDRKATDERWLNHPIGSRHVRSENDINQITWQVQSIEEIWQATQYFKDLELDVRTEGRAGAGVGSNYHLYVYDPDDQINELFTGIEQIGWDGLTKPREMGGNMPSASMEPHISEYAEVQEAMAAGISPTSGFRYIEEMPEKYSVDGMLLARPFKIVRIGPLNVFVDDIEATTEYYRDVLGLAFSEEVDYQGHKIRFLRCDTEHHSIGLFPRALWSEFGLSESSTCMSFGVQLANYRQLREAVTFLRENGVRVETDFLPAEVRPGMDYRAYAFDPDGHCIELYCYMEQIGWDGQVRPAALRPQINQASWPESIEYRSDTFSGEPFLGPWS